MRFTCVCTCVFIALLVAPIAAADGKPASVEEEVEARIEALKDACRERDVDRIGDAITALAVRSEGIVDDKLKKKMRSAMGRACRFKDQSVQHMAIDAFGRMGDPAACRYILPFIKRAMGRKVPPLFDPAMRAIESLAPESAVRTLLRLVTKSKNHHAASRAMEVLGAYKRADARDKAKILDEIIGTVRKEKPGVKGRERPLGHHTGSRARNRWEALAGPMVRTANSLTGQSLETPSAWFEFYADNKRKPDVLFQDV